MEVLTPRTAIRLAVKDRLAASLPAWDERITESRISVSRATPLFAAKLPAVLVYTREERLEEEPHAVPGVRRRTLDVAVEVVAGGEDADTTVDRLAFAVEAILEADETLGNLVTGSRLSRTEVEIDGDGEQIIVAARLTFEVSYWTRPLSLVSDDEERVVVRPPDPATWAPPASGADQDSGVPGPILGITPGFGEEPEPETTPHLVLAGMAPEIGPPHEPRYKSVNPDTVSLDE